MTRPLSAMAACAAAFLAVTALAPRDAAAGKETYIFLVSKVDLSKGIPKEIDPEVTGRLIASIKAHDALEAEIPKGAPDPESAPEKFRSYLKAHNQRAFKMNVLVSQYSQTVEPAPGKASSQYLTVRVSLRLFAETFPERGFALTGDGSATIKLEIGKSVSAADKKEANAASIDQAIASAVDELLLKLRQKAPAAKKKKKK
ncbi:MAG TPA: hypothetical protein VMZ28_24475 [Kofleriaceae bacterium]|nr:hypothetical protein [Kofleriaceae bacterium]